MPTNSMGFLARHTSFVPDASANAASSDEPCLLRFDDGTAISMTDANYNVIALGSTGSGKTTSAIMPAVHNVLSAGYYGIMVDIKGNLGPQIRSLAKACGREADIVEFGTSSQATPINLLACMSNVELRNLFEDLFYKQNLTSHNEDFHQHGIQYALDICNFLRIVQTFDKRYTLSLEVVERLLRNPEEAHQLYAHFLEKWFNKQDQGHMKLYMELKNHEFHPLCRPLNDVAEYWRQYAFATHGILGAISILTTTPAIVHNFFGGNTKLDFKSLIYDQKKVVILRFAAQAEAAGEIVSRILLSMFYRVMLSPCGLNVDKNEKTFVIIDEFQQLMDLTGRFSDDKVLARSREFNNIFLVASQSMAGMYAKAHGNTNAVHAMLTNFREKLIFNCDDPDTSDWIQRYGLDAKCLPLGEVVALRGRDSKNAAEVHNFLHKAHASVQKLVNAASTQGCDLCEAATCMDEIPPIVRYQRPHQKLDMIFSAYRAAEVVLPVPITLKDFAGIPNSDMWLELSKKFYDCFEWKKQKAAQLMQLFNKPELNSVTMGQLCKTLSRIKAVGLLPKIQDFRFQENGLVLESSQGEDMDRVINMIAADTSILQKEQKAYERRVQNMRDELRTLQYAKEAYVEELRGDDYPVPYARFQLNKLGRQVEELLSTIQEVDKNAHCTASWCVPCAERENCAIFNTLTRVNSQKQQKRIQQTPAQGMLIQ